MKKIKTLWAEFAIMGVFLISLAGMIGSLYFSEIEKLPPCPFCWWARVWMYPIVFIAAVAIAVKDKRGALYILILSLIGTAFGVYHNFVQLGLVQESESCTAGGLTCADPTIALQVGGLIISLEFLSMMAFVAIDILALGKILIDRGPTEK